MACGVLGQDASGGSIWHTPVRKPDFVFPVHALSGVFRGKFMAALQEAHERGLIPRDPQGDQLAWRKRHAALYRHGWVVYAKTPLGGPAQVLEYLSRYTHRTAISNERIGAIDQGEVEFAVRAAQHPQSRHDQHHDQHHGERQGKRRVRLDGSEFVRRFLLHVLPDGLKRIRHYGVLASACKKVKLALARAALQMPPANPLALESAQAFMARVAKIKISVCPTCKAGPLHVAAVLLGRRWLPAPGSGTPPLPRSRGPP
jgi:hypothetical protein